MSTPIDTSTTAGKIAVMQAFSNGSPIECNGRGLPEKWLPVKKPTWNWEWVDYRIQELADDEIIIVTYKDGMGATVSASPRRSYAEAYAYMGKLCTQGFTVSHRVYKEKA